LAPSFAALLAIANPIPLDPPVMNITLSIYIKQNLSFLINYSKSYSNKDLY